MHQNRITSLFAFRQFKLKPKFGGTLSGRSPRTSRIKIAKTKIRLAFNQEILIRACPNSTAFKPSTPIFVWKKGPSALENRAVVPLHSGVDFAFELDVISSADVARHVSFSAVLRLSGQSLPVLQTAHDHGLLDKTGGSRSTNC